MEKMTISEFGRFLSEKRFGKIILCSDNQQDDSSGCPQKIDLIFRIIKTAVNPNVVCLQGALGSVCFRYVDHITIDPDKTPLGVVIHIFCNNLGKGKSQLCYTLVGR